MSDEASSKIKAVIERTGYVANDHARSLATGRSNSAAVLLGEPQDVLFIDPNFATLLRSIADELGKRGMSLIMMTTDNDAEQRRNISYLRGGHVDGVIVVSWHNGARTSLITALHRIELPMVVAEYPSIDADVTSYVHVDDYHGSSKAAAYLMERGGRRIGMIAGPEGPSGTRDRVRGFADRLDSQGLKADLIEYGDYSRESGAAAMSRLLAADPKIDSVFAASDLMAVGALKTLKEHHRRIPQDVQVVGFDDQAAAKLAEPSLTTIRQPFIQIGVQLVRQLVGLISGDEPSGTTLPLELVVRESTR